MTRALRILGIVSALLLAACGGSPSSGEPAATAGAGRASTGPAPTSPARPLPPPTTRFTGATFPGATPACTGTTVHEKHLQSFACATCHPAGATFGFDTALTFPRGTTTAGGTLTRGVAPAATTCTVACHFPMGGAPRAIAWNAPGPLDCTACHDTGRLPATHPVVAANAPRATCAGCHDVSNHLSGTVVVTSTHAAAWMDQASPGFHAFSANQGLASCQGCHGADLAGGTAGVACARCHDANLPSGVTSWTGNCVMCHGGTDSQTGAPPRATWGNAGDAVRAGAHTVHGAGSAIAPAYDCGVCHATPVDALAAGHVDAGPAEVAFSGIASIGGVAPAWTRTTATCSNVYCHGGTLSGGSNVTPSWTGGGAQASCGTCHGLPPPAPHPSVAGGLTACASCHPQTMDATGAVIPPSAGGRHLDGILEVTSGHPAGWMDQASPGFHAFAANASLATCQRCHGADLEGQPGAASTACASCHGQSWKTSCTMCHGGTENTSGAPPRATWGNAGDPIRVGAHSAHVNGSAIAAPIACAECHVTPTDALSAGHADGGTATVTFGSIASGGGATPLWTRGTATCATSYCHGTYQGTFDYFFYDTWYTATYRSTGGAPQWTDGPMTCTSCHGNPPNLNSWHNHGAAGGSNCDLCHPDANAAGTAITNPALHVNGVVDLAPQWGPKCLWCH